MVWPLGDTMAVLLPVSGVDTSRSGYTKDHAKRLTRHYLKYGSDAFEDKRPAYVTEQRFSYELLGLRAGYVWQD